MAGRKRDHEGKFKSDCKGSDETPSTFAVREYNATRKTKTPVNFLSYNMPKTMVHVIKRGEVDVVIGRWEEGSAKYEPSWELSPLELSQA